MAKGDNDEKQPIFIIKKVKKVSGGHHGGAWKVAYADFVTAMMAFFLLLWLLNVTTKEQKELISSYFAPTDPRVSQSTSGAGGVMGGTTMNPQGAMTANQFSRAPPAQGNGKSDQGKGKTKTNEKADTDTDAAAQQAAALDRADDRAFQDAKDKLQQAIESVPELKALSKNLLVDMTPEGLRIQIVDQQGKPMFAVGSATPLPPAEKLLHLIGQVVRTLPNKISIRGHTDSLKYSGSDPLYTNWELSADRANASRRVMLSSGVALERVDDVQGRADRDPLVPSNPESARNRRISIILLRQSITSGARADAEKEKNAAAAPATQTEQEPQIQKQEPGVIYFP